MKKGIYLLGIALLLSAAPVYANCGMCGLGEKGSMSSEDWLAKKMEKMTSTLSLTEEQVPQVEALIKEKMEKKEAIKTEMNGKIEAMMEEYSTKIKALLSDEQKVKYEEMKAEGHKDMMKGSGHEHMHEGSHPETGGSAGE